MTPSELHERLLALADSLDTCEWNHPLLSAEVCRAAADLMNQAAAVNGLIVPQAERVFELEAENARLRTQREATGLDIQRLELRFAEAMEQLRQQTKSFCTHCGKFFPKGKEGVRQFQRHIAECNKHPLQPLAAENARLRKTIESYGNNPAGFDWAVLGRIDELEAENARLCRLLANQAAKGNA